MDHPRSRCHQRSRERPHRKVPHMNIEKTDRVMGMVFTGVEIVGACLSVWLALRLLAGPDGGKTLQMSVIRSLARTAKHNGERLTALGNRLDSAYWKIAQP